jgi:ribonuclease HI
VHKGLSFLATSDFSPRNLVICIDNTAAIGTLQDNNSNSEPARIASTLASLLAQKGWKFSSLWTPTHRKIEGNEHPDEMAKKGAESSLNRCPRSFSSKNMAQSRICPPPPSKLKKLTQYHRQLSPISSIHRIYTLQ